jgi:hypothetical protein
MSAISASESATTPLPEKIALLVHEARWLLVGLAGLYLGLILWGFERTDPGWSHAAVVERVANPGGFCPAAAGELRPRGHAFLEPQGGPAAGAGRHARP